MPTGREKGHLVSEETRKKISDSVKKRYQQDPSYRKRVSESLQGNIPWNIGIPCTEEHKKNISEGNLGKKRSEETRAKMSEAHIGKKYPNRKKRGPPSEETRQKIGDANRGGSSWSKGIPHTEEHRQNLSKALKGKPSSMLGKQHSEETKKKMSIVALKKCREDMTYWKRLHKSLQLKPNKPEKALDKILQNLLPSEYKYVGDLSFILGGKNPDFMNINGRKKLIEIYGDYWHKDDDPQDRIDFFKQYGFDTLVIRENELKNKDKLKTKLEKFHY